jgi:ketosteroid isomerase-like protein
MGTIATADVTERDERVMRTWTDATCRLDIDAMAALLSPEVVSVDEPSNTRYYGIRGFIEYAREWWTGPFTFRIALGGTCPRTDGVWEATYHATLTHVGTFRSRWGDAAPTGRECSFNVVQRCTVVDGRITEVHVIYNLVALLRAIGITPPRE